MPSLTLGQIKTAIRNVEKNQKATKLSDGDGRGVGRLVLVIKPMPHRIVSSWYAQQYTNNKKSMSKIGEYPNLDLNQAREKFINDYAATIQQGASIKVQNNTQPGTIKDLFDAYVYHLKSNSKSSHGQVKKGLDKVVEYLGHHRLARDIQTSDILDILRPIYERGKRSMADHIRGYVRAAYSYGLKMESDYRTGSLKRFHLQYNPAADIPTEMKVVGTHWLDEKQWCHLWHWLLKPDTRTHRPHVLAMMMIMLTGQRVTEITTLRFEQYDAREKIISWSRTKNGRAHAIPLPQMAIDLLESIQPNEHGLYFPSRSDPSKPVHHDTLCSFLWRGRERGDLPLITNRDLRRTFKTLTGKAGISKDVRDRIQNHSMSDVSSRHYDRYAYMQEKRQGMQMWNAFVTKMLSDYESIEHAA